MPLLLAIVLVLVVLAIVGGLAFSPLLWLLLLAAVIVFVAGQRRL